MTKEWNSTRKDQSTRECERKRLDMCCYCFPLVF